jgi:hypothetical protein
VKNPFLRFNGGAESGLNDPRAQSEDLGANQMETCELGIKNLKIIVANLPEWTKEPNQNYQSLTTMYPQITSQFNRYIGHVSKWIGGVYADYKTVEQDGPVYSPVSKADQKTAMSFLNRNIFNTPMWLLPDYMFDLMPASRLSIIENLQTSAIEGLVNANVLVRMLRAEEQLGSQAYSTDEFFTDLSRYIFGNYSDTDIYRRSLQNIYVNTLCKMVKPDEPKGNEALPVMRMRAASIENNDIKGIVTSQLNKIAKNLKKAGGDERSKVHYQYLYKQISDL